MLDDSDDRTTQLLIKEEVHKWQGEGVNIVYRHRVMREGYKAGNLKSAMNCNYVKGYEFVAIFDADFQPAPDFLKRTLPHFKVSNSFLALLILLQLTEISMKILCFARLSHSHYTCVSVFMPLLIRQCLWIQVRYMHTHICVHI